jgi:hypothetical protein
VSRLFCSMVAMVSLMVTSAGASHGLITRLDQLASRPGTS